MILELYGIYSYCLTIQIRKIDQFIFEQELADFFRNPKPYLRNAKQRDKNENRSRLIESANEWLNKKGYILVSKKTETLFRKMDGEICRYDRNIGEWFLDAELTIYDFLDKEGLYAQRYED
jgi:hypothetical protein